MSIPKTHFYEKNLVEAFASTVLTPTGQVLTICDSQHFTHICARENSIMRTSGFLAALRCFGVALNAVCSGSILFKLQHFPQKTVESSGIDFAVHSQGRSLHHQRHQLFAAVVGKEISIQLERGVDDVAANLHSIYFLSCLIDTIIITDNLAVVNTLFEFFQKN